MQTKVALLCVRCVVLARGLSAELARQWSAERSELSARGRELRLSERHVRTRNSARAAQTNQLSTQWRRSVVRSMLIVPL